VRRPTDFGGLDYAAWETGAPILDGCLAALDCAVAARHDGGDHVILVGRVLRLADFGEGAPLVYHRGRYTGLATAD
jgi:flavin reductase (DIM6/NTAB) family NADH-FMN oxidoreductase RutF